jgi:cell division protein FtsA
MAGVRLEAKDTHCHRCGNIRAEYRKCANQAGLDVCDIILEPIASCESVLTPEEREVGTGLIDIGGGTTDLAIFSGNTIRHTFVLSLGGNNMTNDISVGLRIPMAEAEKIKINHGTCLSDNIKNDETIDLPDIGGRRGGSCPARFLPKFWSRGLKRFSTGQTGNRAGGDEG